VDVFAGTGAVGIEALSRGAAEVVFIENHSPAVALIRKNLESLGVRSGAAVFGADALRGLEMLAAKRKGDGAAFDFVFLDPPYAAAEEYARVLRILGSASFLAPGSVIIAEHHKKFDLPVHAGSLTRFRVLKQGDAALSFYRFGTAA
jgi:16S rRNA (guanine(966)-N(2))-methyltransferase RsmD